MPARLPEDNEALEQAPGRIHLERGNYPRTRQRDRRVFFCQFNILKVRQQKNHEISDVVW